MKFRYVASQPKGEVVEGDIEAKNVEEVLNYLASQGLKPISVKVRSEAIKKEKGVVLGQGKITLTDKIFIAKYLSLMLKLGTGLLQAVNILIEDFDKRAVRAFLLEVRDNIENGNPFYVTFAKYPNIFDQVYVNLIKAGEASGSLDRVFENITQSLVKEKNLRESIKSALIYPLLLLVASILILIFLVMYALPKISKVFEEGGFHPPLFSRIVFAFGGFFGKYGFFILGFFILVLATLVFLYRNSIVFKKLVLSLFFELPLVKDIVRKLALQRFAATLASLMRAGIPLVRSLEITAEAVGNIELKEALLRIAREGLAKGLTVGDAFRKEIVFPRTVVNLIAISEKAGHMENILETLADFYAGEIDSSLKSLVSVLEPLMLMGIGLIVGIIALAIIVPIYQLTTQF